MAQGSLVARLRAAFAAAPKALELPLSAYGKLPFYKDFLRHRMSTPEAAACRRWLDQGFSHFWASDPRCREHTIATYSLLLTFPGCSRSVLAQLWGSHDEGGLRRFPFCLLVGLESPRGGFGWLSLLEALAQVSTATQQLRRRLEALTRVDDFYAMVRSTTLSITLQPAATCADRLRSACAELTVAEFTESLYPETGGDQLAALLAYLRRHRLGRSQGGPLAARLPCSHRLDTATQASLWHLLSGVDITAARQPPMQVICPVDNPAAGLTLLARALLPDDAFIFNHNKDDYEQVEDLRQRVPSSDGDEIEALADEAGDRPLLFLLEPATGGVGRP